MTWARAPAGLVSGPTRLKMVRKPSARRSGFEGFHGGVIERREEEHEAGLAQALDGELGAKVDGNAESFEDICGAALRSDGAIAVLGYFGAGCGCHQGRAAGDVEGLRAAPAGAYAVDEFIAFRVGERHGSDVLAHHIDEAGELRAPARRAWP